MTLAAHRSPGQSACTCGSVDNDASVSGVLLPQMRSIVERVMREVQAMPPPAELDLEAWRMQHPPMGCFSPTCVHLAPHVSTHPWSDLEQVTAFL